MSNAEEYLSHVLDQMNRSGSIRATASGVARQTASAAAGTAAGGLLAGPAGALVGGLMGGIYGYLTSENYSSLLTYYQSMDKKDKEAVTAKIQEVVGGTSLDDFRGWFTRPGNSEILLTLLVEVMRFGLSSPSTSSATSSGSRMPPPNGSAPPPYGFHPSPSAPPPYESTHAPPAYEK